MDLGGRSETDLSLGLHARASPRPPIADDSIFLQTDPTLHDPPRSTTPLHLFDHQSESRRAPDNDSDATPLENGDDEEHVEEEEEEISILGYTMSVKKRRRRGDSASSSCSPCHPSKRPAVEPPPSPPQPPPPPPDLESRRATVRSWGNLPLSVTDPDVSEIMEKEKQRQVRGIELVASENFVCRAVLDALGSHLTNKYSEGLPGARYYCGNQFIDRIERLCCDRALAAFGLDAQCWGVNVQPYSCTSANFAVYTGLLLPKDRIMGLDSPSGGHVSHGYYMPSGKKISGASIFFESLSYKVNPHTGYIDYDKLEEKAMDFRPKILICGGSSYPREWDYARFRQIADKCGAVLMCDMAHISGLVAAKECRSPFDYCDIVTSTTHKSLRGPRGGIIFFRKGRKTRKQGFFFGQVDESDQYDFEDRVNFAVFPSMQGGPHNNHIAALAIALKQVATPEYKAYIQQVKKNAQALASALLRRKCRLVTGGTDNHLLLWDLRTFGLTGKNFEKVCEACHITLNKTPIYGDNGAISPGGVRIGTPAMTTRGCLEGDFEVIAEFLLRAAQVASTIQKEHGKLQKDFLMGLQNNKDVVELCNQKIQSLKQSLEMV
uniref:Serine hydroxymethyltransferase n=1 Tax=Elaeis guineensis var. tenera TaxID=51953 RepID=A0A8N4F0J9_ELAGV|nr:serine hydroxymethyltransferase 7 isoform X2 [Elaeis guineensis]